MKTSKKTKIIASIISIYCLLYFIAFIFPFLFEENTDYAPNRIEIVTVIIAFLLFLIGSIIVWFNSKTGGIILLFWHFICWVFALLVWPDAGMVLVLILPILFLATICIQYWYETNDHFYKSAMHQWKLSLRILLFNYLLIYSLIVYSNIFPVYMGIELPTGVDELAITNYTTIPGSILIFEFILFIIGYILSWRNEIKASIIFILWYLILLYLSFQFPEFSKTGPSALFGFVIIIQSIFYISNHFKTKKKKSMAQ